MHLNRQRRKTGRHDIIQTLYNSLRVAFKKLNWENNGLNIDGRNLTNLRFADDIVLLADNLKDIKDMLQELQNACADVDLQMNISKTNYMTNLVSKFSLVIRK